MKVRIEGNKEEMSNLLKPKSKAWVPIKSFKGSWKNTTKQTQEIILILFVALVFVLIALLFYQTVLDRQAAQRQLLSPQECLHAAADWEVQQSNGWGDRIWFTIQPFAGIIIASICISWILHGIGFRII